MTIRVGLLSTSLLGRGVCSGYLFLPSVALVAASRPMFLALIDAILVRRRSGALDSFTVDGIEPVKRIVLLSPIEGAFSADFLEMSAEDSVVDLNGGRGSNLGHSRLCEMW